MDAIRKDSFRIGKSPVGSGRHSAAATVLQDPAQSALARAQALGSKASGAFRAGAGQDGRAV